MLLFQHGAGEIACGSRRAQLPSPAGLGSASFGRHASGSRSCQLIHGALTTAATAPSRVQSTAASLQQDAYRRRCALVGGRTDSRPDAGVRRSCNVHAAALPADEPDKADSATPANAPEATDSRPAAADAVGSATEASRCDSYLSARP